MDLVVNISSMQQSKKEREQALDAEIRKLEKKILEERQAKDKEISSLEQQTDNLKKEMKTKIQQQIDEKDKEIEKLKSMLSNRSKDQSEKDTIIQQNLDKIEQLSKQIGLLNQEISTKDQTLNKLTQQSL